MTLLFKKGKIAHFVTCLSLIGFHETCVCSLLWMNMVSKICNTYVLLTMKFKKKKANNKNRSKGDIAEELDGVLKFCDMSKAIK